MKLKVVKVYDVDTPSVKQVISYLKSIGYSKEMDNNENNWISLMNPANKIIIEIPAREDFSDYERRLQELFDDLARIYNKDCLSVWSDIVDFEIESS